MKPGALYIIPISIAENNNDVIPEQVKQVVSNTKYFIVENVRTARRFISSLKLGVEIENLHFEILNKGTRDEQIGKFLKPTEEGYAVGIMSESGCPGVADPGSRAVHLAHKKNIQVVPLVGPSSIIMAVMASGFNGQQFAFHGYLPIDKKSLVIKLRALEDESRRKQQTQLFIEAPYRNNQLIDVMLNNLYPETQLSIASDISGNNEFIKSAPVKNWGSIKVDFHKIPTIYAIYAGN